MKLFGSVHFGTLMKIPRSLKYNGKSPMNEKILKGIIIAFALSPHSQEEACRALRIRQKKVIHRNFNWTFISALGNDFRFLSTPHHLAKNNRDAFHPTNSRMLDEVWRVNYEDHLCRLKAIICSEIYVPFALIIVQIEARKKTRHMIGLT